MADHPVMGSRHTTSGSFRNRQIDSSLFVVSSAEVSAAVGACRETRWREGHLPGGLGYADVRAGGVRLACRELAGRVALGVRGCGRRVGSGPGVAWPKSRCSGCKPAALATEPFPGCPPGPRVLTARRASAFICLQRASLTCRLSARSASFDVLPPAIFLS